MGFHYQIQVQKENIINQLASQGVSLLEQDTAFLDSPTSEHFRESVPVFHAFIWSECRLSITNY